MYCTKCGSPNDDNSWKCVSCREVLRQTAQPPVYAPPTSGKAIGSLVCSLLGLSMCPLIGQIIGIVLGYQAKKEIQDSGGRIGGDGIAKAGLIIGWIGLGLNILFITLYLLFFLGAILTGIAAETM